MWREFLKRPEIHGRRAVGLAFDLDGREDVAAFLELQGLELPTYSVRFDDFTRSTGAVMVPSVVVTDSFGRVLYVTEGGSLDRERQDSILSYLGAKGFGQGS